MSRPARLARSGPRPAAAPDVPLTRGHRRALDHGQAVAQLATLLESARVPIWAVDRDHRLLRFNAVFARGFEETIGVSPEPGRPFEASLPSSLAVAWHDRLECVLSGESMSFTMPFRRAGVKQHYEFTLSPIRSGPVIIGALGIARDVTWQHTTEARLQAQQATLAVALAAEQRAREASDRTAARTARLLGVAAALSAALTPADVCTVITERGLAAYDAAAGSIFLLDATAGALITHLSVSLTGPESAVVPPTYPLTRTLPACDVARHGRPLWFPSVVEMCAAYPLEGDFIKRFGAGARAYLPLTAGERLLGVLGMRFADRRDFDDDDRAFHRALAQQAALALERARLYEAAERANQLKSDFVAMVSHEVRAPLQGILGLADVLLATPLDAEQVGLVETVRRAGQSMLTIVDDILDYSRIEADRLTLDTGDLDVAQVIGSVLEVLAESAERKGLEIVALVDPTIPTPLVGDAQRLRQVLTNLVSNAIAFTERGSVVVRAMATPQGDDTVVVRLVVSDTGPGIPSAAQGRLFDAYTQAAGTVARQHGGAGLGLAICQRLIALMGGEIGVVSEPGHGSLFWCTVPLGRPTGSRPINDPTVLAGRAVLVVSPSALTLESVRWPLTAAGASVTGIADAAAAIDWLADAAASSALPDTIILDVAVNAEPALLALAQAAAVAGVRAVALTPVGKWARDRVAAAPVVDVSLPRPVQAVRLVQALLGLTAHRPGQRQVREVRPAGGRVLVAEDDPVSQQVFVHYLADLGHPADVVASGTAAVEAALSGAYALVLMDWRLEAMDGGEAAMAIRRAEALGRRVPIVAVSAATAPDQRSHCLAAGMDDLLVKPVTREQLATALERWLPAAMRAAWPGQDPAVVQRLRRLQPPGEPDVVAALLSVFQESARGLVAALRAASATGDAGAFRWAAHTLRGSSASLGLTAITALAEQLHALGEAERLDQAATAIDALEAAVAGLSTAHAADSPVQ
ncbi:MAG: response regulator [Chloroflexi bacterium]|nr:response regulator [Chloroflexota bacterium]